MGDKKIFLILAFALVLRLLLAPFGTLSLDSNTYIAWSNMLAQNGFATFYQNWSDYLPGYLYILFVLGKIKAFLGLSGISEIILYKLPAILADIGTGYLIYLFLQKRVPKFALPAAAIYLFNPAIIANSTIWGQVDSFIPFFVLLAVSLVERGWFWSALALSFGTLIKPQAAFAAPLLAILVKQSHGAKSYILWAISGLVFFVVAFIPFSSGNLIDFVTSRLSVSANQYPYTSINAFNFWAIISGFWQSDSAQHLPSIAITVIGLLATLLFYKRQKTLPALFITLCLSFFLTFLFLTRIHERHLLPVLAPLAISAAFAPAFWVAYFLLSVTYLVNLLYSYVWITQDFKEIISLPVVKILSLVNLASAAFTLLVFFKPQYGQVTRKIGNLWQLSDAKVSQIRIKNAKQILLAIFVFFLVTRLAFIWQPGKFYFDEVYHAYTATEIAKGNPEAWEYWASPPEDVAYEWTHPPLAKLIMVAPLIVFGPEAYAWRIPGIIFGLGALVFVYFLAKLVFKSELVALIASGLFALDGLLFAMSRIGMNDIYFLFFALGTLVFFLNGKHLLGAVFLGLAISSKWTAIFLLPILGIAWLIYKKEIKASYLLYFVLPLFIYFASYFHFFLTGHNLTQWWETQQQMWWYHSNLHATHPYSSPWWSWPLMLKPLWAFTEQVGKNISDIYLAGNPVIFYGGATAVIASVLAFLKTREKGTLFILVCYFGLFLPWAVSPRIMFIYHYLPAVPFMILLQAWVLAKIWETKYKYLVISYFVVALVAFLAYYPILTGIPIDPSWKKFLL